MDVVNQFRVNQKNKTQDAFLLPAIANKALQMFDAWFLHSLNLIIYILVLLLSQIETIGSGCISLPRKIAFYQHLPRYHTFLNSNSSSSTCHQEMSSSESFSHYWKNRDNNGSNKSILRIQNKAVFSTTFPTINVTCLIR